MSPQCIALNETTVFYRTKATEVQCRLTSVFCAAASSRAYSGVSPDTQGGCPALLVCLSGATALYSSTHQSQKETINIFVLCYRHCFYLD